MDEKESMGENILTAQENIHSPSYTFLYLIAVKTFTMDDGGCKSDHDTTSWHCYCVYFGVRITKGEAGDMYLYT